MKKTFEPIPLKEYEEKVKPILIDKIHKQVINFYKTWSTRENWIFSFRFLFFSLPLFIGATVLLILFLTEKELKNDVFLYSAIALFVLSIGIVFLNFYFRKKRIEELFNKLDQKEIFSASFTQLKGIDFINLKDSYDSKCFKYRLSFIPLDARKVKNSKLFTFKVFDKYIGRTQVATFRWTRHYGRNTTVYYYDSAFIEIDIPQQNEKLNFTFTLKKPIISKNTKKLDLENDLFVKKLNPQSLFPVKSRIIFTPLSMERIYEQVEKNKIQNWNLDKVKDKAIFNFKPINSDQMKISIPMRGLFRIRKTNLDKKQDQNHFLVLYIFNNILYDFYYWYQIISIILIPPFL